VSLDLDWVFGKYETEQHYGHYACRRALAKLKAATGSDYGEADAGRAAVWRKQRLAGWDLKYCSLSATMS
jgi:hypothetical protein